MTGKSFFYTYSVAHPRTGKTTGAVFGLIHAESQEAAQKELFLNMGINGYALQIFEVTEQNAEAYIGIPSGELLSVNTT